VVRKGNPLEIKGVDCLQRDDVDLLGVELENMGRYHASRAGWGSNVRRRVNTGQEGVAAWRAFPELDAWITYRSWHVELGDESDFIGLPGDDALRYTPVALTSGTSRRQEAQAFIEFLKSPQARRIFVEHGWE
jgi:accessory colonization factor AcfC